MKNVKGINIHKIQVINKTILIKEKNLNIYNILSCLGVLECLGLNLKKYTKFFKKLKPLKGRGKIYKIKRFKTNFNLIDESYNSNPLSIRMALKNFSKINKVNSKKYVIIGDMLELGSKTDFYHKNLSKELIQNSNILILGISYKPDVKDIQLTPAEHIIRKLQSLGTKIHVYDPYFSGHEIFGIKVEENLDNIIEKVNASIIITAHKEFKEIELSFFKKMKTSILIDTRGIIDPICAKESKLIFRGLGRGSF